MRCIYFHDIDPYTETINCEMNLYEGERELWYAIIQNRAECNQHYRDGRGWYTLRSLALPNKLDTNRALPVKNLGFIRKNCTTNPRVFSDITETQTHIKLNVAISIKANWGLPCNNSIGAWRHLLSLFSSNEMIGNLSEYKNTEFSPKKICCCRGSKTAQNWSTKLFSAMLIC